MNKKPFTERTCDDDEAAIQAFIDSGKNSNTEKSREQWGINFKEHLKKRNLTLADISNLPLLDEELTRFYYSLKKKNGSPYEVSSLRTSIGPLSHYLSKNIPGLSGKFLSIYKGAEFSRTRDMLDALFKEGAIEGRDIGKHKTVLTDDQELKIVSSFNINTPTGLLKRICYTVSKYGCFRGQGCVGFPFANVMELPQNEKMERSFQFTLPQEKNNQRGLSHRGANRTFSIPYNCKQDNDIIALYLSKRPSHYSCESLFLKPALPSQAETHGYWYEDRPAPKKLITLFMQAAARELEFGKGDGSGITGHSIRATAITQLARHGIQDSSIMKITGHKSSSGLKAYKQNPEEKQHLLSLIQLPRTHSPLVSLPVNLHPPSSSSTNPAKRFKQVNMPFKPPTFIKK